MTLAQHRKQNPRDQATVRRLPELHGVEILSARYFRQVFKPHAHDEYVLGVIEGGIHAVWCRGELHRVPAGTVVTMRPGDVHHGGSGSEQGWRQRMIYIGETGIAALLSDIADREIAPPLDFGAAFHARPKLAQRFVALHEVLSSSPEALSRDVALDTLMRDVLRAVAPAVAPENAPAPDGRIADAVEYLSAHVAQDVTLAALCAVAGLRRRQTIEAFRRQTGLPPHAWHIQNKVRRVQALLRDGMSATAAAAEMGFADQSHMTRHFKAIVGLSPGAYARG